jgi:hypothetical protein
LAWRKMGLLQGFYVVSLVNVINDFMTRLGNHDIGLSMTSNRSFCSDTLGTCRTNL